MKEIFVAPSGSSFWSLLPVAFALALGTVGCAAEAEDAAASASALTSDAERGTEMRAVPPSSFCPTAGRVDVGEGDNLHVDDGGMRGVVAGDASRSAELAFTYLGPSREVAPLGNGELRRQLGLKLRAKDTCNVVYVTWHVEPTPGIFVSVKHNPNAHTHEACRDGGYVNVRPSTTAPSLAKIRPFEPHTLRADLDGDHLRVLADGVVAWEGTLPPEASSFDGPAGTRSDNGAFDFQLRVPGGARPGASCPSEAKNGAVR